MYIVYMAYKERSSGQQTFARETTGQQGALEGKQHKNKQCLTAAYNEERHIKHQQKVENTIYIQYFPIN